MKRTLRAKLPNGIMVSISPHFEEQAQHARDLAGQAERLAALLGSQHPTGESLLSFLVNVAPVVFPEADTSRAPEVMRGPRDQGVDLTFGITGSPGVGIVEIKTPLLNSRGVADELSVDVTHWIAQPPFGLPIAVAYVIAGRRKQRSQAVVERVIRQGGHLFPLRLLSWDDVVDRLTVRSSEADGAEFKIVLIEIVQLSRRLLSALLSTPSLLSGIDDRKFEELIATLLFDLGLEDVELTPPRKDGGRDIIVTHTDESRNRHTYLIECKHWVSGNKVTLRWALTLLQVRREWDAAGAVLVSSSGFGPRLLEQEAILKYQGLFLKDESDLRKWLSVWERQYGSILVQPVDPRQVLNLDSSRGAV
jgi:Restriction endonuclease